MKSTQWDSSWPQFVNSKTRQTLLDFWAQRFGVPPAVFSPFDIAASSRVTYLIRKSPHLAGLSSLCITRAGLPFTRNAGRHLKPVTEAVQLFGPYARRNVLSMRLEDIVKLCREEELQLRLDIDSGFVFLEENGYFWGCALFLEPDRLICRLPKNIKKELIKLHSKA